MDVHYKTSTAKAPKVDKQDSKQMHMCHSCGKTFLSKTGLNGHIKSKHLLQFRFKCEKCAKGFVSLYNYRGHMASHDKVFEQKCPKCPVTFRHRSTLLQHIKAGHNEKMEFKCNEDGCTEVFHSARVRREHIRAIHEEKVYTCSKCNSSFKWRSSLSFHKKNHHLDV